jgi:hypothetical protein
VMPMRGDLLSSSATLREFVEAFLPFDEQRFTTALRSKDEVAMAAAAGAGFAVVVRSRPAFLVNQAERLRFCSAVSRAGIFEGKLPVWMVEAVLQGATGSPAAIQGIPPDLLIEIQIFALKEMSGRSVDLVDFTRFIDDAVDLAEKISATLPDDARPSDRN